MTVGERIKKLRQTMGLTQAQLAKYLHMSWQSVSKWEQNVCEPSLETLTQIADIFQVDLNYLITGESSIPQAEIEKSAEANKRNTVWNIFVALFSVVSLAVYVIQSQILYYSMPLFLIVQGGVFLAGVILTYFLDSKTKTVKDFCRLLIPVLISLVTQGLIGLIIEL